jgi:hypothetical protein
VSRLPTLAEAMRDKAVNVMLPVAAASLPTWLRKAALEQGHWREIGQPDRQDGCEYGCKVYGRQRGCVKQYAVHHSSVYGHPKPADLSWDREERAATAAIFAAATNPYACGNGCES